MNYTEAVRLARNGNEKGYKFLYKETYQSKYYISLQYMKNEEAAKDVLQDSYIKAFSKLDTLENPEKFSTWLGIIVANTAKNELKKNQPILFTELVEDSKEEEFEDWIEDENVQNQPEMAYSEKETKELVHELIHSLSEEQKMCILMYHIEGHRISEIAQALGCSENTVKSRLNYGRKNIKKRAEELQEKGYKLYNLAPIPLLLYLLKTEQKVMAAEGTLKGIEDSMSECIMESVTKSSFLKTAGTRVSSEAVKQGFFQTIAGKAVIAGIGICIATGGIAATVIHNHEEPANSLRLEEELQSNQETEEDNIEQDITEEEYSSLLAGNLTKEQFEFVLSYGPEYMKDSNPKIEELCDLMFCASTIGKYEQIGLEGTNEDKDAWVEYDAAVVNNMISVLTAYSFNEGDNDKYQKLKVSQDKVSILIVEPAITKKAKIKEAKLKGEELTVEYQLETIKYDENGEEQKNTINKTAVLGKLENETFRVISITDSSSKVENSNVTIELFSIIPSTFYFSSGAGGWSTELSIKEDGSFSGIYQDSDMGSIGEEYPNGTKYLCNFSGKFAAPTKLNEYTYSTRIESIEQEKPAGEEYFENGVRYIASTPYGLENAGEILFYLPQTPITELPQEFLSWAFYGQPETETLDCYGIYNVNGGEGFTGTMNE